MLNKRYLETAAVGVLALVLTIGSLVSTYSTGAKSIQSRLTSTSDSDNEDGLIESVTVEQEEMAAVTATGVLTEEQKEWLDKLMININGKALNVRAEATTDSAIVGKMEASDLAVIVEAGEEWTFIKSGNVEGYVLNEYTYTGLEAFRNAQENFDIVAKSSIDGLRVRKEPNTDAKILKKLKKGDGLELAEDVEVTEEGWVAVMIGDSTGYIKEEYVDVSYDLTEAMTMEEIKQKKLEEERKKALEEAKKNQKKYSSSNTVTGAGVVYSEQDLFLLAALIYCEMGSGGYDMQLAAAAVVVNRIKSSRYPNSVYDVIYQRGQFGPASSGSLARRLASGRVSSSCLKAAQDALNGVDNTQGAIGFKLARTGHAGVVIGSVVFF